MKHATRIAVAATALVIAAPAANAFECPRHFAAAQERIDKVANDMKATAGSVAKEKMALVHALLDDAKSYLSSGRHNHEKPQGAYDHARSIAKADAAAGYALAAELLHEKMSM